MKPNNEAEPMLPADREAAEQAWRWRKYNELKRVTEVNSPGSRLFTCCRRWNSFICAARRDKTNVGVVLVQSCFCFCLCCRFSCDNVLLSVRHLIRLGWRSTELNSKYSKHVLCERANERACVCVCMHLCQWVLIICRWAVARSAAFHNSWDLV